MIAYVSASVFMKLEQMKKMKKMIKWRKKSSRNRIPGN